MNKQEILTILAGAVITASGIYFVCTGTSFMGRNGSEDLFSSIILIVGGIISALFRKDVKNASASILFTIGVSTAIGSIHLVENTSNTVDLILGDVYLILSMVITYYGLTMAFNTTSGNSKGVVCVGILAAMEIFPTLYRWYMGDDVMMLVETDVDKLAYGVFHMAVVLIFSRKEMRLDSIDKRLLNNSTYLFNDKGTDPDCYIDRPDMIAMLNDPEEGWVRCDVGPISEERTVPLQNTELCLRLQRWAGDERIHLAVAEKDSDAYTVPLSFAVESVVLDTGDCETAGKIRFYGNAGVFVEITVRNKADEKKGYVDTLKYRFGKAGGADMLEDDPAQDECD